MPGAYDIRLIYGEDNKLSEDREKTVVFLFDHAKRGISLPTRKHYEKGFRVFAFKIDRSKKPTFFGVALTLLSAWKNIQKKIEESDGPFVCTIHYDNQKVYSMKMN